jgi:Fur family transcriptional regulator, peroxide stress response regulator
MDLSLEDYFASLRSRGLRMTPKRRAILELLIGADGRHYTAHEIFEILSQQFAAITLATIYNNLHALERAHAVTALGFSSRESARYEITHGTHINLICESCGGIEDTVLKGLSSVVRRASEANGFQIERATIELFGMCRACRGLAPKR